MRSPKVKQDIEEDLAITVDCFTDKCFATFSSLNHQKLYRASTGTTKSTAAFAICNFARVTGCSDCFWHCLSLLQQLKFYAFSEAMRLICYKSFQTICWETTNFGNRDSLVLSVITNRAAFDYSRFHNLSLSSVLAISAVDTTIRYSVVFATFTFLSYLYNYFEWF